MIHDERLLSMPLTDAELDELEVFLTSSAVPEDCMSVEMLDGYLTAAVSSPQMLMPSQWLPKIWGENVTRGGVVFASAEQAQQITDLILRHWSSISRTLREMPTRFHPLLYYPSPEEAVDPNAPHEAFDWCQGYMMGVQLTEEAWTPLYDSEETSDWIFPIEALAFGDQEPEYAEWFDDNEKRDSLVDELPIAAVLIYRFWSERQQKTQPKQSESGRRSAKKTQEQLH